MAKTNVAPFNSLPFEERKKIAYYTNEEKILTIRQVISMLDDSIGQYQKRKLRDWLKNLEKWECDNWVLQESAQREDGQDGD